MSHQQGPPLQTAWDSWSGPLSADSGTSPRTLEKGCSQVWRGGEAGALPLPHSQCQPSPWSPAPFPLQRNCWGHKEEAKWRVLLDAQVGILVPCQPWCDSVTRSHKGVSSALKSQGPLSRATWSCHPRPCLPWKALVSSGEKALMGLKHTHTHSLIPSFGLRSSVILDKLTVCVCA